MYQKKKLFKYLKIFLFKYIVFSTKYTRQRYKAAIKQHYFGYLQSQQHNTTAIIEKLKT